MSIDIKRFVASACTIRWIDFFVESLYKKVLVLNDVRLKSRRIKRYSVYSKLSKELSKSPLVVKEGKFEGLKYPHQKSCGSELLPKIFGSYEDELHEAISLITKKNHQKVVDVGCGEGYYAVGFLIYNKNLNVIAVDTNEAAVKACQNMATINQVQDRLTLMEYISPEMLIEICVGRKLFIFSDCEGYEKQLFTHSTVEALKYCDLIIEVHDFVDKEIGSHLKRVFSETHICKQIFAAANKKDRAYLRKYNFCSSEIELVTDEKRPAGMYWLVFEPRLKHENTF